MASKGRPGTRPARPSGARLSRLDDSGPEVLGVLFGAAVAQRHGLLRGLPGGEGEQHPRRHRIAAADGVDGLQHLAGGAPDLGDGPLAPEPPGLGPIGWGEKSAPTQIALE